MYVACTKKTKKNPKKTKTKTHAEYRTITGFAFVIYDPPAMTYEMAIGDTSDVLFHYFVFNCKIIILKHVH